MNRYIKKVAVLGSGIMGAGIACHFANIGVEVLLMDLPKNIGENDKLKPGTKEYENFRNKTVSENLKKAIKTNPSPLYLKSFAERIFVGNFEDDMSKISDCDWVIEAVVENLEIKQSLFEKLEKHRKSGTIVTTNTSGIPIMMLTRGRSREFAEHFCGTHFFNPPRYLKLLEIIPGKKTLPSLVDFLEDFGKRMLGKTTVLCKDKPAFIANRLGVFSMLAAFNVVENFQLKLEEIDKLTGSLIGRPKSATFRTADLVGLDTLMHVVNDLKANCPKDELLQRINIPQYVNDLFDSKHWGNKSGQGFYKKEKDEKGKSVIKVYRPETGVYEEQTKVKYPEFQLISNLNSSLEVLTTLFHSKGKLSQIYKALFYPIFAYASHNIPEISDDLVKMDKAIKAGFGWQYGIFETWEAIGVEKSLPEMEEMGYKAASWVYDMLKNEVPYFYEYSHGTRHYYSIPDKKFYIKKNEKRNLHLDSLRAENTIWKNEGASIIDLGDGVINLEFHTKMNVLGTEIFQAMNKALDLAEKEYKALTIYNDGEHFSAGANVGLIFMLAREEEWDELNFVVQQFQKTILRLKYSSVPVIAAPHGFTFGGGCELSMHCDRVLAHAETYMGLVEMGVGVIPAGGGTKEFALRLSEGLEKDDVRTNRFREKFLTIGQAKVSTSALEAFEHGYLRKGIDSVVMNREMQLSLAKEEALLMLAKAYRPPYPQQKIQVLGKEAMGLVLSGADGMHEAGYITEHEKLIAEKLGFVLCGGDIEGPAEVSEQYLLDLERKAFVELCMTRKTMERLQSIIQTGKPLRN